MSHPKRILIGGASGLIGNALADHLESAGHEVKRLVRRQPESMNEYEWDPYEATIDDRALKGVDAVVSLSGAGIGDRRWTESRKKVLYESRMATTSFLAESLAAADEPGLRGEASQRSTSTPASAPTPTPSPSPTSTTTTTSTTKAASAERAFRFDALRVEGLAGPNALVLQALRPPQRRSLLEGKRSFLRRMFELAEVGARGR